MRVMSNASPPCAAARAAPRVVCVCVCVRARARACYCVRQRGPVCAPVCGSAGGTSWKKERTVSSLLPSCNNTSRMCVAVTNAEMNRSLNLSTTWGARAGACVSAVRCALRALACAIVFA